MRYIDLHLHSYYSDGVYSPVDLVKRAKKEELSVISIVDHNCLDGIVEAIKIGQKYKIKVIPGVEIDTSFGKYSFHILGYKIDFKNKELNSVLKKIQEKRKKYIENCLFELEKQGFRIDKNKVFKTPSKNIGLGWLVDFLKEGKNWQKIKKDFKFKKNKIITFPEIFKRYFIKNKKQILPTSQISFEKAIFLIKKAGGFSVLAHPSCQLSWKDDWLFPILKKKGLDGIEAVSSHHNWANIEHYQKIAKEFKFLITIGSDYHGDLPEEWKFPIKSLFQYFKIGLDPYIRNSLKILIC